MISDLLWGGNSRPLPWPAGWEMANPAGKRPLGARSRCNLGEVDGGFLVAD